MTSLATMAVSGGVLCTAAGGAMLAAGDAVRRALAAFPRHRWLGWVLTAIALFWVTWIVYHARLGRFEYLKPWLFVAAPVSFGLIVWLLDDLLAPRAGGGLLLLAMNPVLCSARLHPSAWSVVMSALAYVVIVAGMAWVLGPYRFRRWLTPLTSPGIASTATGTVFLGLGVFLLILGLRVY